MGTTINSFKSLKNQWFGALLFFSTYVIMFNKLINANKKHKDQFLGLTTGVIAMFVAFMFINLFDNMMFTPKVMLMFMVCVNCVFFFRTARRA